MPPTMSPPVRLPSPPLPPPWHSYQRATTKLQEQNDDSASSSTSSSNNNIAIPNSQTRQWNHQVAVGSSSQQQQHRSTSRDVVGLMIVLVTVVVVLTAVRTSNPTGGITSYFYMASTILPTISRGDTKPTIVDGANDHCDNRSSTAMNATKESRRHHRVRMIRQQLQYLQEQIRGTVYFPPPCRTGAPSTSEYPRPKRNPREEGYDTVAMGWIKQHPLSTTSDCYHDDDSNFNHSVYPIGIVIVQVLDEYDVQVAVPILADLYQTHNFPFRIRSGGHHKAGYSSFTDVRNRHRHPTHHYHLNDDDDYADDGAVLSLSLLNHLRLVPSSSSPSTRLEPNHSTTTTTEYISMVLGPAVRVQDVLRLVTRPYRYGGVMGFCGRVAEGGFVLGGGFGVQSRMYGLGLDSVSSFRIVLFNGTVITTSPMNNADLHWALLGAGSGSYGVVTEMEYQIYPVSDTLHLLQVKFYNVSKLAYFLYQIGSIESTLPDNIVVMHDAMNAVTLWWTGADDAEVQDGMMALHSLVESILGSGSSTTSFELNSITISWTGTFDTTNSSVQSSDATDYADWGTATWAAACWTGFLFPENNTIDVWANIVHEIDLGLTSGQPYLYPDIELWGGAISRRASNATAFPYRSAVYNVGILLIIPLHEPNGTEIFERETEKVNSWWYKVDQYLTGSYVNYPSVSLLNRMDPHHYARVLWGENLPRLVKIKQQYDPNNVFQFPMSVPKEF